MKLIDSHCHFDFLPFVTNISESINLFKNVGVKRVIIPAVSEKKFDDILQLVNQHDELYCALGLHPIYSHQLADLEKLANQLESNNPKIVAVGEIGLDALSLDQDIASQKFFLDAQLNLAKQYNLPVILHSRKTHSTLFHHLKNANLVKGGVIHAFSGSYEEAMQFIRLGFFIGVGGIISYDRANKTRHAICQIPLSTIILETDSPDMPLSGYQGQANRPERIVDVLECLSQLREESKEIIAQTVFENTLALFPRLNMLGINKINDTVKSDR